MDAHFPHSFPDVAPPTHSTACASNLALKAAALDATGIAFEICEAAGPVAFANEMGRHCFRDASPDAPDREEISTDGRTMLVERASFSFGGRAWRVSAAVDIDAQRRLQDELFQRAYFDRLTGLPNRELCDRAISELMRTTPKGQGFAVAILDIVKFSQINAYHGNSVGDELLTRIAERITGELGADQMLARSGGDEFTLLLPGGEDPKDQLAVAERVVARVADPYYVDGTEVFTSALAGVSLWPRDDSTAEGLRQKALAALAETKRTAGSGARLYQPDLDRAELSRARIEMGLRAAIRDRRIGCAFQPKMDFRACIVDGLEVLMRWRDEEGRWHSPGQFLDLAHKVGLTNDITRLVFEETIASLDAIGSAFRPGLPVGFNVSAKQAGDTRFMRGFADKLAASGQAHRFVIELTEEAFLPASQFQARVLPMLREIGVKISIDDFGSGYSSLATLADITADEVKVDRSLVVGIDRRPRNQCLLRAIESIGSALGTEVMVEGVETAEELAYLRDFTQIRVAQGYFFSRPITLSEIAGGAEDRGVRASGLSGVLGRDRPTVHSRTAERRLP
ncbi:MAG: EAL domain-containing protein [Roseiarcus sp.]